MGPFVHEIFWMITISYGHLQLPNVGCCITVSFAYIWKTSVLVMPYFRSIMWWRSVKLHPLLFSNSNLVELHRIYRNLSGLIVIYWITFNFFKLIKMFLINSNLFEFTRILLEIIQFFSIAFDFNNVY